MSTQMNTQGIQTSPNQAAPRQAAPAGKNGLALAAVVLGVIGLISSIVVVGGLLGVIGLVLGVLALRTAKRTGVGRGKAITGTVTSSIAIVASVLVAISAVWFAHKTQSCYQFNRIQQWQHCVHQQFTAR
ncbi:DUF4190 domain-containing protein [Kitasatospora sp. NBC_01266]|uniref:DUF4190 domain-containing protein n=1 Tax=Kitasatospora sp. NBC_01266 TaxID=2903572 RepID=UPI002E364E3C|nr:DUF4190 domain-containing protein [Kitasatospora sp. NBC_01266]